MRNNIRFESGAATVLMAVTALGVAACSESAEPVPPPAIEWVAPPKPTDRVLLDIYQVAVPAAGFEAHKYKDPNTPKNQALDGWQMLSRATGGLVTPHVTARLHPPSVVEVPGLTAPPDLCNDEEMERVGDAITGAVVSANAPLPANIDRVVPLIVTNAKTALDCNLVASMGYKGVLKVYKSSVVERPDYAHEIAHWYLAKSKVQHDNMVLCSTDTNTSVNESCGVQEYGNPYTIMGNSDRYDPDPLSVFALESLGIVGPAQIVTAQTNGETRTTLESVASPGSGGLKALRIPVVGNARTPRGGYTSQQLANELACATDIYLELSSGRMHREGKAGNRGLGVRAYIVDSRRRYWRDTFLLEADFPAGEPRTIQFGNTMAIVRVEQLAAAQDNKAQNGRGTAVIHASVVSTSAKPLSACS